MSTETAARVGALRLTESLRLWAEAERLIPGGSQTNSKRAGAFALGAYPIYAARAAGCRIWDVDGNEYLDFVSALGPVSLGYGHPAVDDAIREQLGRGIISGLLWPVEVEVARGLLDALPGAASGRPRAVRFFKGGGEGTAAAARIARAHTGRHVILNAGYRGWPDVWAAGRDPAVPAELAAYVLPFPHDDLDALRRLLEANAGKVAAVFMDLPYSGPLPEGHLAPCATWPTPTAPSSPRTRSSAASGSPSAVARPTAAWSPIWPSSPRGWPTGCPWRPSPAGRR